MVYPEWHYIEAQPALLALAKIAAPPELSSKEQRKLEALSATIERRENEQQALREPMAQPDIYKQESGSYPGSGYSRPPPGPRGHPAATHKPTTRSHSRANATV